MANPNMKKGMPAVNPKGRPPSVFQSLNDRRSHFLEKFTRSEILAIAADDKRLDDFSSFDAQILIGLSDILKRTPDSILNPSQERERFYDRTIGKASQSIDVNHTGTVAVFTADISPITDFIAGIALPGESDAVQAALPGGSVLLAPIRSE